MDERKGYIQKRNICIAVLLAVLAAATVLFVLVTAQKKEDGTAQTPSTQSESGERAAIWNGGIELSDEVFDDFKNEDERQKSVVFFYGDLRLGVSDGAATADKLNAQLQIMLGDRIAPDKCVVEKRELTYEEPSTFDSMLESAYEEVLREQTVGCGMYVDEQFVGAAYDEDEAQTALDAFLAASKEQRSLSNGTVELRGVSYRKCAVKKKELLRAQELEALIACCCDEKVVVSGVNYAKITQYAAEITLPEDSFVVVKKERVTEDEIVKFETRTVYDHALYTGYFAVRTEGSDGLIKHTYELTYENGTLVSKEHIGKSIEKSAVDRIEVRGDREYLLWPLAYPSNVRITSSYGYRDHPIYGDYLNHTGVDIAGPKSGDIFGDNIYAAMDGVVVKAVVDRGSSGYGTYVIIDHGTRMISGRKTETLYAHCDSICVKVGDTVKKGQVIGRVGTTGASTGPHLHFEVRVDGAYTDPLGYRFVTKVNGAPKETKEFIK